MMYNHVKPSNTKKYIIIQLLEGVPTVLFCFLFCYYKKYAKTGLSENCVDPKSID